MHLLLPVKCTVCSPDSQSAQRVWFNQLSEAKLEGIEADMDAVMEKLTEETVQDNVLDAAGNVMST